MTQAINVLAIARADSLIAISLVMCWISIAMPQSLVGDEPAQPAAQTESKVSTNADIGRAIQDLASSSFRDRQAAHQQLVAAGNSAIDALENAVKKSQLEAAARCLEVLAQIGRDDKSKSAVIAALERLAKEPSNRIASSAAKIVTDLKTTPEDRAIAVLTAEGVRIFRIPSGELFSVSITRDSQLTHLKHLPSLRSVKLSGKDVTDAAIEALSDVKRLYSVDINRTSISDDGLRKLKRLATLESLTLG